MKEVVIVSAARTPVGSYGGKLKDVHFNTRCCAVKAIKTIAPEDVDN